MHKRRGFSFPTPPTVDVTRFHGHRGTISTLGKSSHFWSRNFACSCLLWIPRVNDWLWGIYIYIYIYHQTWMNFTNNHQQHGSYMIPIRVGIKLMGISLQCGMGPFMFETIVFAKYMCFLQIFASAKSGIGLHHGKCRCLLRSSCYPHWGCWSQRCRTACGLLRNRGSGMSRTLISYTANTPRWTQHKPT